MKNDNHNEHEPISRKDAHKLLGISAIQASLAIFSLGMASHTGVEAFRAEGAHDISDTLIDGTRAFTAYKNSEHKRWFSVFRRLSYTAVCGFGLYASYRALSELQNATWVLKDMMDSVPEVVGAGVIAVGNQASYSIAQTLESKALTTQDSLKHKLLDRDVSIALAGAIVVGTAVPYVSEVAGVAMGVYTAWNMRPTDANMNHNN